MIVWKAEGLEYCHHKLSGICGSLCLDCWGKHYSLCPAHVFLPESGIRYILRREGLHDQSPVKGMDAKSLMGLPRQKHYTEATDFPLLLEEDSLGDPQA
jgi:hypothetical protein